MNDRGVTVQFITNNLRFGFGDKDHMSKLMLAMLAAFAEFEKAMIRSRQAEGIALVRSKGVYKKTDLTDEQIKVMVARARAGENKVKLAKEYRLNRDTLYEYLKSEILR